MANRYYLPGGLSQKEQDKLRQRFVCAECGEWLSFWLEKVGGPVYLACHRHNINSHEGVSKEFIPPSEQHSLARRETMSEENINQDRELMVKGLPLSGIITKEQATIILKTIWPGAPEVEIWKASRLCQDFGLHPLMKHVYLIKYDRYAKQPDGSRKKVGEDWTTVLGIGATRLIMSRQGTFSYIDDTPRIMSEDEQKRIFGRVDLANIVAITKLRTKSGLEASGYGKYEKGGKPMGTDKGNSVENMAFIRSERNAFGRLFPDARLPRDVGVVDEEYMGIPGGKVDVEEEDALVKEETSAVAHDGGEEIATTAEEDWNAMQRDGESEKPVKKEATKKQKSPRNPDTITSIPELQKALTEDFGLDDKAQRAELNLRYWTDLAVKPAEAYSKVSASYVEK